MYFYFYIAKVGGSLGLTYGGQKVSLPSCADRNESGREKPFTRAVLSRPSSLTQKRDTLI